MWWPWKCTFGDTPIFTSDTAFSEPLPANDWAQQSTTDKLGYFCPMCDFTNMQLFLRDNPVTWPKLSKMHSPVLLISLLSWVSDLQHSLKAFLVYCCFLPFLHPLHTFPPIKSFSHLNPSGIRFLEATKVFKMDKNQGRGTEPQNHHHVHPRGTSRSNTVTALPYIIIRNSHQCCGQTPATVSPATTCIIINIFSIVLVFHMTPSKIQSPRK